MIKKDCHRCRAYSGVLDGKCNLGYGIEIIKHGILLNGKPKEECTKPLTFKQFKKDRKKRVRKQTFSKLTERIKSYAKGRKSGRQEEEGQKTSDENTKEKNFDETQT